MAEILKGGTKGRGVGWEHMAFSSQTLQSSKGVFDELGKDGEEERGRGGEERRREGRRGEGKDEEGRKKQQ